MKLIHIFQIFQKIIKYSKEKYLCILNIIFDII
jgi:hypothetical protein